MTRSKQLPVKVLSFDLDDTLWPLKPTLERAEKQTYEWLQQHAPKICNLLSVDGITEYRQQFFAQHASEHHQISALRIRCYHQLASQSGYSQEHAASIAAQAFTVFIKLRQQVRYFDHAQSTLETLSQRYLLGAITNGNADLNHMSIGHLFGFCVSAEQAACSKPEAAIFKLAQQQASNCVSEQLLAQQIVHIGDGLLFDIFGANAAGFKTVWFNHDDQITPKAGDEKKYVAQANASVNTLAELLTLDFDRI